MNSDERLFSRRTCLQAMSATVAVSTSLAKLFADEGAVNSKQIVLFVKPVQELSFDEIAQWLVKWDLGGLEATVRKGGWIERQDAMEKLPRLMDILHKIDRSTLIMASDINSPIDEDINDVLRPAAKLGVKYIRMKYYKYDLTKPILPQIDSFISSAKGLAKVCEELNVVALYQNHAGAEYFGAPLWDLATLVEEVNSPALRIAVDTRHTPLEATEAWKLNVARIRNLIGSIFVKSGEVRNGKIVDVPLLDGSPSHTCFNRVRTFAPNVPLCLHMEHMDHTDPRLLPKRIEAISHDVSVLKNWIKQTA